MQLTSGPIALEYVEDGDPDGLPVLVLHGITQSTRTWDWLVPHLPTCRVVRLDFRGHGRSGRSEDVYEFRGYVDDAIAICEQVLGAPAVVVGHSLGGATALALAQQRPDLVRGVVIEDAPFTPPPAGDGATAVLDADSTLLAGFRLMRESVPRLQESGIGEDDLAGMLAGAPAFGSEQTFGELLHPDAVAAMADGMLALDARVLDPVIDPTLSTRGRPLFDPSAPLPVPGIVVAADPAAPDHVTKTADVARLGEHSPHVECRVLTGVGHLIHDSISHRAEVLRAVQDLLALVED